MSKRFGAWMLVSVALLAGAASAAGPPADVLTIGAATVEGGSGTVRVPVYLEDVPGTPLGMDQPADHRISALAFNVVYGPNPCVGTADPPFDLATGVLGSTQGRVFVAMPGNAHTTQALVVFYIDSPISLTRTGAPGDKLGDLVFELHDCSDPIHLMVEAAGSRAPILYSWSNASEQIGDGSLAVVDGWIAPPGFVVPTRTPPGAAEPTQPPAPQIATAVSVPALDRSGLVILALALSASALLLGRRG